MDATAKRKKKRKIADPSFKPSKDDEDYNSSDNEGDNDAGNQRPKRKKNTSPPAAINTTKRKTRQQGDKGTSASSESEGSTVSPSKKEAKKTGVSVGVSYEVEAETNNKAISPTKRKQVSPTTKIEPTALVQNTTPLSTAHPSDLPPPPALVTLPNNNMQINKNNNPTSMLSRFLGFWRRNNNTDVSEDVAPTLVVEKGNQLDDLHLLTNINQVDPQKPIYEYNTAWDIPYDELHLGDIISSGTILILIPQLHFHY